MQCSTVHCFTVQCSGVQYSALYMAVQRSDSYRCIVRGVFAGEEENIKTFFTINYILYIYNVYPIKAKKAGPNAGILIPGQPVSWSLCLFSEVSDVISNLVIVELPNTFKYLNKTVCRPTLTVLQLKTTCVFLRMIIYMVYTLICKLH